MSHRNGDRARADRQWKAKIRTRARIRALAQEAARKGMKDAPPPEPTA